MYPYLPLLTPVYPYVDPHPPLSCPGLWHSLVSTTTKLVMTYTPTTSLQACNFDVVLDGAADVNTTSKLPLLVN